MIDQILGYTATIIFSAMIIPQLVKTLKTKTTKGLSITMFIMYFIGNCVAICYATLIGQNPLQIKYSFALVITAVYIISYYKIKRKENGISSKL
jgi:MtN3 and saliva related transmembrane protein